MPRKRIHQTYQISLTASDMIHRVGRLLKHRAEVFFRDRGLDLSPEQWGLLLKVAEKEDHPQGKLADGALRDYPNVTRLLDALEEKGLTVRRPSPQDRRCSLVSLTESGKQLIDEFLPEVIEEKGRYFDGLNEKDVEQLRRVLTAIESNILRHYK